MASATADDVYDVLVVVAPEFSAAAQETAIKDRIDQVIQGQNISTWGSVYFQAMAYLTAHHLKKFPVSGSGESSDTTGGVTSRRAGDLARTFGQFSTTSASKHWYMSTAYGQAFLALRRGRSARAPSVYLPRSTR